MVSGFLDSFAHFCLKFGHITIIFPIVVLGMIFHKRDLYAKAVCFLLWVMIFNTLLKQLFKVPLFPHLGPGYAFPSGHMHASCAFYGYILYKTRNEYLRIALGALLCCIAFSLIYCRFHDLLDVAGAVGFFAAELLAYHVISHKFDDKVVGYSAIASALVLMLILNHIYKIEFHVWLAFYGLAGMELALLIKDTPLKTIQRKILALAIAAPVIAGVYYLFKYLAFSAYYLSELRFLLVPFIIVGAINLAAREWSCASPCVASK